MCLYDLYKNLHKGVLTLHIDKIVIYSIPSIRHVEIIGHDSSAIEIVERKSSKGISVELLHGVLTIQRDFKSQKENKSMISISRSDSISRDSVLSICVPKNKVKKIEIDTINKVSIFNLSDTLNVSHNAISTLDIQKITNLKIKANGTGNIKLDGFNNLNLHTNGLGKIDAKTDFIHSLAVSSNSVSEVVIKSNKTEVANLCSNSLGKIFLESGEISVVSAETNSMGNIVIDGRVSKVMKNKSNSLGKIKFN